MEMSLQTCGSERYPLSVETGSHRLRWVVLLCQRIYDQDLDFFDE